MNASATSLDREIEVQSKIRKVRTFGRIARVPCAAIFGFGLVAVIVILLVPVLGLIFPVPHSSDGFTPQQKFAALPIIVVTFSAWLAVVYQLYHLFGNLAAGAIYTQENVRRVRNVGLLWLLWAVLGILIPMVWTALYAFVFVDATASKPEDWFSWPESVNAFVTAGLILLTSWIMDVGLYEKDHADALKRDADLVI